MNIIFDIGNVLLQWDPAAAFAPEITGEKALLAFLERTGFAAWNTEQDRGRSRAEAIAAVAHLDPGDVALLDSYFDRFDQTIQRKVPGTWDIHAELAAAGHRIFGLTNWSAELYPVAERVHPELAGLFEDVLVSGREGLIKPDPAIYRLLLDRNGLTASDCLFIDDSPKNVAAAREVGMQAVLFTDAGALRSDLVARGLL